ncbi:MAG: DUF4038 domain-containing protein [Thermomicrobiales bacterium]
MTPATVRGFLRSTPAEAWGFRFESGEPAFIFGDTVYHLFGMAHNSEEGGTAVRAFMERRAGQGFNLLRIRLPVSRFHHPDGHNVWQTKSLWPWGGSEQMPRFDRFNLEYFRTVDLVMQWADEFGIGIEMIMEAWGNEFPFNNRSVFTAEWEELWVRYLIARYDAFSSVHIWTLHNEYEYYPNGDWHYSADGVADRWAMRVGHLVRRFAPHGHVIAIHNGPVQPSFGKRFASDATVIDTVMFQTWGTTSEREGWLAAGIENGIAQGLGDWPGSAVFSEWGYEFNPDLPPVMLGHRWCGPQHTRRGAWRGAFSGLGIIHGFENSWGPFQVLDEDQPGVAYLLHLRRFFTELVNFACLRPVTGLATSADTREGYRPLALATPERDLVAVYLPAGGEISLHTERAPAHASWFDPRTGELFDAALPEDGPIAVPGGEENGHPADWVLLLRA